MEEIHALENKIGYFQVDLRHKIRLGFLFQLFQEAAIRHANQFQIGTGIMENKGESWVLNRVAMQLIRYPAYEETITIRTWATQLKQFKGFREFRLLSGDEVIGKVSTLWLYISLEKKAVTRLPFEVEESFLTRPDDIYFANLDKLRLTRPGPNAVSTEVSLRFSDLDGNQHVNNTAFIDMLQTALHRRNLDTHPKFLEIHFAKEIPPDTESVAIKLEPTEHGICFSLGNGEKTAAFGRVS